VDRASRCLVIATIFALLSFVYIGYATNITRVYVDPPSIVGYSYSPGTVFTINVSLNSIVDLRNCQLNMTYDGRVIGCFGMLIGPSENEPFGINFGWDDELGEIWINVTYRVPVTSENQITLSTIFFFVKARGESPLDIYSCSLLDSLGNSISCEVSDGYFCNFNPYDINNDGVVDMLDISIAAYAFGSYPGHPRWNPLADVNHDNYVDMVDLSLIARHFGEL